ncbi:MAG: histidinol dehydrogenase [Oscillospiraceae bacterium]|nr:histidinol dehydrogenase [Oscillospiraceae bacterium]
MLKICGNENELFDRLALRTAESDSAVSSVSEIIENIRRGGDTALSEYSFKFDGIKRSSLFLSEEEKDEALNMLPEGFYGVLERAAENIKFFHEKQKRVGFSEFRDGKLIGQRILPLGRVALYVPGGTASYPSTVLMNAIPASVAGVRDIVIATPPKAVGINPAVIAAAKICGIKDILCAGGAQAIAALAYGTESVKRVDKIVGPGNLYVATAKRLVFGTVDIDMIAGPSEVLVIADGTAVPEYVAADLLSQAEHDPMAASVLLTDSEKLVEEVCAALEAQLEKLSRRDIAARSINSYGSALICKNITEACRISDAVAPEHLEICTENPFSDYENIHNAGSVFLGQYSPEPFGDYCAGPNHVLPTNGTARFSSPLGVDSFIKRQSFLYASKQALTVAHDDIVRFAEYEGLGAHANAVKIRFGG